MHEQYSDTCLTAPAAIRTAVRQESGGRHPCRARPHCLEDIGSRCHAHSSRHDHPQHRWRLGPGHAWDQTPQRSSVGNTHAAVVRCTLCFSWGGAVSCHTAPRFRGLGPPRGGLAHTDDHQSVTQAYRMTFALVCLRPNVCLASSCLRSEFYWHSVGHWLGLDTHDTALVYHDKKLVAGHVITIEPGLYIPDEPRCVYVRARASFFPVHR